MEKEQVRRRGKAVLRLAAAVILCFCTMLVVQRPVSAAEQEPRNSQYNILLIGTDKRDDSWNGNSDVMIVATLRRDTKEIILTSFMRDLYADIPGYGVHKLNYAYAAGGAGKLMETLEDNYELSLDNYAVVDFGDMAGIVDLVGGVEITVSDDEVSVLNGYLTSMNAEEDFLPYGGTFLLNGNQAVAYMRIRYVGNNDYQRTQRQRDVLKEIFASMHGASVKTLTSLATQLFTGIENDIGPLEMLSLLKIVPELGEYELRESRVPYDDLYTSQNEMLVPDFEATIERLHEELGE